MNKKIPKITKTLFFLFTLSQLFVFFSCANFMDGAKLKKDLNEQIKLATAEKVTVNLELTRNIYGTLSTQGEVEFNLGYAKTINFIINSDYEFDGWKIVKDNIEVAETAANTASEKNPLAQWSNDYIKFEPTTVTIDGVRKSYSVNVTVLKAVSGLTIRPVCHLIDDTTAPEFYGDFLIAGSKDRWNNKEYLDSYQYVVGKSPVWGEKYEQYCSKYNMDNNSPAEAFNRTNGLLFSFSVKEEDSDSVTLKVYEYPTNENTTVPNSWSTVPEITEYKNLISGGQGLYKNSGDYIFHELKTANDVFIKVVFMLEDSAGNVCSKPVTYYVGKDTKCECELFIESSYKVINLSNFTLSDNSILSNNTVENLVKEFSKYTVYSSINSEASYCGGFRDKLSYSYEYSIDSINYKPIELKNLHTDSSDPSNQLGEIDFSEVDRNHGIYLKTVVEDEIGNSGSKITYIPHSNSDLSASYPYDSSTHTEDKDNIYLYGQLDSKNSYTYKLAFCFYTTIDESSISIQRGSNINLFIPYEPTAEKYNAIMLQGWNENCYALVSNIYTFTNKDVVSTLTNNDDIKVFYNDIKVVSKGKNSGKYDIEFYSSDFANTDNFDSYNVEFSSINALYSQFHEYQTVRYNCDSDGHVRVRNAPTDVVYDSDFTYRFCGYKGNKTCSKNIYYSQIEFWLQLIDNEPPQINDETIINDSSNEVLKENQIFFNDTHNEISITVSDRSGFALDENGNGKIIVYYSTIEKNRTEAEIKELSHFDIDYTEADIKYDKDLKSSGAKIINKKPYSIDFSIPLYNFAETKYQFYVYVEDNSTQKEGHNYCFKEINVNLDKENFSTEYSFYKFGKDISSGYEVYPDIYSVSKAYSSFNTSDSKFETADSLTDDTFNRVVLNLVNDGTYSYPVYFWPEDVSCEVKNMSIYNKNFTIMFDQPCLVETVWSEKNWGDENELSPYRWDFHTPDSQKVSYKIFKPSANGTGTMKNYSFENEYYKFYNKNCYYCVIVHFADGTCMMSPVYKNE